VYAGSAAPWSCGITVIVESRVREVPASTPGDIVEFLPKSW
jgi:hypothetical protein